MYKYRTSDQVVNDATTQHETSSHFKHRTTEFFANTAKSWILDWLIKPITKTATENAQQAKKLIKAFGTTFEKYPVTKINLWNHATQQKTQVSDHIHTIILCKEQPKHKLVVK